MLAYLGRVDPEAAAIARERYACLGPFGSDPASYGRMAISEGYARCEEAVVAQLRHLLEKARDYAAADGDDFLDATQNARLIANAEAYCRAVYYGAAESWNLRDRHMFDTLDVLLRSRDEGAKAVVWASATRARPRWGRAAASSTSANSAARNMGGRHASSASALTAGPSPRRPTGAARWRSSGSTPRAPAAMSRASGYERSLPDLREGERPAARALLTEPRLERFIGVIYRPDTERWSHYASASLPEQYDAWVWFDETSAVEPLTGEAIPQDLPDTYPFGL